MNDFFFETIEIREISKTLRESPSFWTGGKKTNIAPPKFEVEIEFWPDADRREMTCVVNVEAAAAQEPDAGMPLLSISIGIVFKYRQEKNTRLGPTVTYSLGWYETLTEEALSLARGFLACATMGYAVSRYPLPSFDAAALTHKWLQKHSPNK
jgi:hypothetical protein